MALLLLGSGLCGTMTMTVTVTVIAAASVRCVLTVRAGAVRMTVHNSVPAAGAVGSPLNATDRQEAHQECGANQLASQAICQKKA